jgi:predicted porin
MHQKKLIALAIAALASGVATAQTNVTVYGLVDVGFTHRSSHLDQGIGSKNAIDSGIASGNRLGFKGTEDLGNGITALFTLEAGFGVDDGQSKQSGRLFGRQAFLGLTGNFGTALAGRYYTPHYSFLSTLDPFKGGTVGRYNNVFTGHAVASVGGENLFDPTRVDNVIAYVSPSFAGFNVTAAYSANAIGHEATENVGDNQVFALLPRYTNGPLDVGVSYHRIKNKDGNVLGVNDAKITNLAVGASYDLKVVKLSAFYDQNKLTGSNVDDAKLKSWLLGASVPFGNSAVQFSYTQSKLNDEIGIGEGKVKQWALGYTYQLSKRTNFYSAYAHVTDPKKNGVYTRRASTGDSSNGGDGYRSGLQFGLKHTF